MLEATCTEEWVSLDGGIRLHVLVWPSDGDATTDATPFLLVHGLASNAWLWAGVAGCLAAAGHRAVAVDLRGHGRSAKPETGYDSATAAADLAALIGALGLHRPVVAGQSWGGNVVIELAATRPELISGAICVDGGWIEPSTRFATWEECALQLAPPALAGTPAPDIEATLRTIHPGWSDEAVAATMANFEIHDDLTVSPWLTRSRHLAIVRDLWERHPRERYPDVGVPVLLVPVDTGAPWMDQIRVAVAAAEAGLARSTTHWFTGDHDIHAERPDDVAAVLLDACRGGCFA